MSVVANDSLSQSMSLNKRYVSIRLKLVLIFGVLIAIAISALSILAFNSANKAVREKVEAHLVDKAKDRTNFVVVDANEITKEELAKHETTKKVVTKAVSETVIKVADEAKAVIDKADATLEQVNAEKTKLETAIAAFEKNIQMGTKPIKAQKPALKGTQIAAIVILCIAIIVPAIMALVKKITTKKEEQKAASEMNETMKEETTVVEEAKAEEIPTKAEETAKEEVKEETK